MTPKRLLVTLLALLITIPEVLAHVAPHDSLTGFTSASPRVVGWVVLVVMLIAFIRGLRGSSGSFTALAAISCFFGVVCVLGSFNFQQGRYQLAGAGLAWLAAMIVLLLLRDEIQAERRHLADPASDISLSA